jgi:putative transposase
MRCKTYELKISSSHLTAETDGALRRLFLEAKWFYNHLISKREATKSDCRALVVDVKTKTGTFEPRELIFLSAQVKQGILESIRRSTKSLASLQSRGYKVGQLRFKTVMTSIPLMQYGYTHRLQGCKIKIQKIAQWMRVKGTDQIPSGSELANATLQYKFGGYFVHITTYQQKAVFLHSSKAVGIDTGIAHQLTLSNGVQIKEAVPITERIRRVDKKLSRKRLRSRNWSKTKLKLNAAYGHLTNIRKDVRNKIVGRITSTFETVAVQNDRIAGWQFIWGKRVTASGIGRISSDLRKKPHTPISVATRTRTTGTCSNCGALWNVGLNERSHACEVCGRHINRDLNAAINIWKAIPAERRELTPVDTKAATELLEYLSGIPRVKASLVEEAGSRFSATRPNGEEPEGSSRPPPVVS